MTERESTAVSESASENQVPKWLFALGGAALVLALVVLWLVVVPSERDQRSAQQATESAGSGGATGETAEPEPTVAGEPVTPEGAVAYVTADGRVLVGSGAAEPAEVATDAAVGPTGAGSVALAPTSDVLAYVRADGALIAVGVPGAGSPVEPRVLATDFALKAVGQRGGLAWDSLGLKLAYLAAGTEELVEPQPDEPPPLSALEVFRVPLPEGPLGDVIRVVDRDATLLVTIGDPGTRSMTGISASLSDDMILVESAQPGSNKPYSLAIASMSSPELLPTVISADEPEFAPDGSFAVMVGPSKGGQELIRVDLVTLDRAVLVQAEQICAPAVSPDSTRITYGTGKGCARLGLVSSGGGPSLDVTPENRGGVSDFGAGPPSWTTDGHHIVLAECRAQAEQVRCDGPVRFLDPDQRSVLDGPAASTAVAVRRASIGQLSLDLVMDGPIQYQVSYPIDADAADQMRVADGAEEVVAVELGDANQSLKLALEFEEGKAFGAGTMTIVDAEAGIDRTLLVLVRPGVIGVRVASLDGVWFSSGELPMATGELRLAIRRT